jgi:hypothetical protein
MLQLHVPRTEHVQVLPFRPDRRDEPYRFGDLHGGRPWIASVNDTLKGQLDLERHGGRTPAGSTPRPRNACPLRPP